MADDGGYDQFPPKYENLDIANGGGNEDNDQVKVEVNSSEHQKAVHTYTEQKKKKGFFEKLKESLSGGESNNEKHEDRRDKRKEELEGYFDQLEDPSQKESRDHDEVKRENEMYDEDNKTSMTKTLECLNEDENRKTEVGKDPSVQSQSLGTAEKVQHLFYKNLKEEQEKNEIAENKSQQSVVDSFFPKNKKYQEPNEGSYLNKGKKVIYTEEPIEKEKTRSNKRYCCPALAEPALFLSGMGYYSFSPLAQEYFYYRMVGDLGSEFLDGHPYWVNASVLPPSLYSVASSKAALFSTKTSLFRCIPEIFFALIICSATDFYGRKIGMILPTIGGLVRAAVYLLVIMLELPLSWLFIGEFVDGACGSHLVMLSACYAFIADTADPQQLVVRFLVGMCMYLLSAGVGNAILGQLIFYISFSVGTVFIIACYGSALLYIAVLPESKPPNPEDKQKFSVMNALKKFASSVNVIIRPRDNPTDRTILLLLLLSSLLCTTALQGMHDQQTVYMLGAPFYLTPDTVGLILGICGLCWGIIPPVFSSFMKRYFSNEVCLFSVTTIGMVCYIFEGICVTPEQLVTVYFISSFGIGAAQANNALMTLVAEPSETGAIQAVNASVSSIGDLLSKTLLLAIYAYTAHIYHGISHFFSASLLGMCSIIYIIVRHLKRKTPKKEDSIGKDDLRLIL